MNPPTPPTFFSALRKAVFCAGGMYGGFWLMQNGDAFFYWVGFAFVCFAGLGLVSALFGLTGASIRSANQLRYDTYSRTPSDIYGDARLAQVGDEIIHRLAQKKGFFIGALRKTLLFFDPFASGMAHMISFGMTRAGKTSSLSIPAALHWMDGSMFISDTKGEICAVTEDFRTSRGQTTIRFDPFNVLGKGSVSFNPLAALLSDMTKNEGKNLHRLVLAIGFVLIPASATEREPFFRNGGRRFLTALLLYLAVFEKGKCHLPGLREIVWSDKEKKAQVVAMLKACPHYGGILRDYGNHLEELLDPNYIKTFGSMRDYAINATMIYDSGSDFGKSLMGNNFNLEDFLNGKTTFYSILPESNVQTHGVINGVICSILFILIGSRPKGHPVFFLLEEAGNMGIIPDLDKILSLLTAKNVRVWLIFQSWTQLLVRYGKDMASLVISQCSMKQYLSVDDIYAAKAISERSGTRSVKTLNLAFDPRDPQSPWKPSVSETARPVLNADQVLTLSENAQVIDLKNQRLIVAESVRYYRIDPWRDQAATNPYHPEGFPKDEPAVFSVNKDGA